MSNKLPHRQDSTPNDEVEAKYSNYFQVGHNAFEFVMDFGQSYQNGQVGVHTRIVTGPPYARELLRILQDSIAQYERQFGTIDQTD